MTDPLALLLDIQGRDIAADQLRHRRASLPERAALAEQQVSITRIGSELTELGERLGELRRSQKKLEDEIATLQAKAAAENTKLYSGTVTSPRELQAMQEEIDGLARRQRALEDEELEIMEAAEPLDQEVATLEAARVAAEGEVARLSAAIGGAEAVIDGELAAVAVDRDGLAAEVPADVLANYETLRGRLGGVAVARLEGTQCTGCHLSLPATEVAAVRRASPGDVVHHEECGRILVI